MAPIKGYYIINLREIEPVDNPSEGFMYLYPKDSAWYTKDSAGVEKELLSADSELMHSQNTDYKLGLSLLMVELNGPDISFVDGEFASLFADKNFLVFWPSTPISEQPYSIKTVDGSTHASQEFYVLHHPLASGTIKFTTDTNQEIGDDPLILEPGDWAKFKGAFGRPLVTSPKTQLIASNKLQGTGVGVASSELSTELVPPLDIVGTIGTVLVDDVDKIDIGGSAIVDAYADRYIVLVYSDESDISPRPTVAHKIISNTTDGVLTVSPNIQYDGTNVDWEIKDPFSVTLGQDNIIAGICTTNIVLEVPAIALANERETLTIYREGGGDDRKIFFVFLEDPVRGATQFELVEDGELITLRAHNYSFAHWDELNTNNLAVGMNARIDTADATWLSNTALATIQATAWNLNESNTKRFEISVLADGSIEAEYTSLISRFLLVNALFEVEKDAATTTTIEFTAEIDTGTGYASYDTRSVKLAGQNTYDSGIFIISQQFNFGDKIRVRVRRDGAGADYRVNDFQMKVAQTNA